MGGSDAVLADKCVDGKKDDNWVVQEGAVNEDAELILNLGCHQNVKIIQIKNLERDLGGTDRFSIFVSENSFGPWAVLLTGELNQTADVGCSQIEMHTYHVDRR